MITDYEIIEAIAAENYIDNYGLPNYRYENPWYYLVQVQEKGENLDKLYKEIILEMVDSAENEIEWVSLIGLLVDAHWQYAINIIMASEVRRATLLSYRSFKSGTEIDRKSYWLCDFSQAMFDRYDVELEEWVEGWSQDDHDIAWLLDLYHTLTTGIDAHRHSPYYQPDLTRTYYATLLRESEAFRAYVAEMVVWFNTQRWFRDLTPNAHLRELVGYLADTPDYTWLSRDLK